MTHDSFCRTTVRTDCQCDVIAAIRTDERERWMREMEEYRDACDFDDAGGDCLGYEDCDHHLPFIYFRMQTAARGEDK